MDLQPADTRSTGLQDTPVVPPEQKPKEDKPTSEVIKVWTSRFQKAEKFLEPWFERDQQAFEFWYMWREFRGPYRANIFPPDVHAGIESVVPRLTKGRPKPIVGASSRIPAEVTQRVQRAHEAYWYIMDMDDKWETFTKRGAWFGAGYEKITWRTTGHEEPVMEDQPVLDETGQVIGTQSIPAMNEVEQKDAEGNVVMVKKPVTKFVPTYHAPFSEICDPARVFFPRGYAREEDLPWVLFQYFKRVSELDPQKYSQAVIDELKGETGGASNDITLDRDKVHRLPRKSQVLGQTDSDNLHETDASNQDDDKDDPLVELWEIYARPDRNNPEGQEVVIANRKKVILSDKNSMPEGELPLVTFGYIEDTFNLRGVGLARELERLVLERADKRNQRMDNVSNAIDSMGFLNESETTEDSEFMHRPNGVIRLKDVNSYKPREVREVTQNAYREDDMLLQDEARATGANEYVIGGGKRSADTLGEADMLASSSNERYDGVIRRLERALNRHARLVHLLIRQNAVDEQNIEWTDRNGSFQEDPSSPEDFVQVDPKRIRYDAKSVIAYKELSRKQGLQLMEMMGKLLGEDPDKILAMKPVLVPLLDLYDEIKINPQELMQALEGYAQKKVMAAKQPRIPQPAQPDVVPLEEGDPSPSQMIAGANRV